MSPFNRLKCPHCVKNYDQTRSWMLKNHIRDKHGEEAYEAYIATFIAEADTAPKAPHGGGIVHEDRFAPNPNPPGVVVFDVAEAARKAMLKQKTTEVLIIESAEANKGAEVIRNIARRLRNANQTARDKLAIELERHARELEKLAFAFDFLSRDLQVTDYWGVKEKAKKWDALMELLPIMEEFLKQQRAQEVRPDVHVQSDGND